jgi:amino acid transporter
MVALIAVLTYFDVRISSGLLAIGLISEVVILLIFDGFPFARGHVSWDALNIANAFKGFPASGKLTAGAVGIGLFFAFWSWVGFEMAPNYGEESRDPKRIVPRALYISVIGLGIFYTITSWASLGGYSSVHAAITQSQTNAANYFLTPATQYAGHWVSSVMSYLIITGDTRSCSAPSTPWS